MAIKNMAIKSNFFAKLSQKFINTSCGTTIKPTRDQVK